MSRHEAAAVTEATAVVDDELHQQITAVRDAVTDRDGHADARTTQVVDARARRYWLPRIALASAFSAALAVVVVLILLGPAIADLRTGAGVQAQTTDELRRLVESSAQAGNAANDELEARGLPTVPIAKPGTAPDSQVIVDAATAQVLAALPPPVAADPSAGDLAAAVAGYFADNPVTPVSPSAAQIAASVAAFLLANPPADGADGADGGNGSDGQDGADGETGDRGPPPTAAEIQAALVVFLADNPNVLCPRGGAYVFVEGAVTLDGPQDFWVCVVASTPPVEPDPTEDPGGGPQQEGDAGLLDGLVG